MTRSERIASMPPRAGVRKIPFHAIRGHLVLVVPGQDPSRCGHRRLTAVAVPNEPDGHRGRRRSRAATRRARV